MRLRRKEGRRDCKEMQIGEEEDREEERRKEGERSTRGPDEREIGGENGERRREREGEEREEEEKRNIDAKSSGTGERAFPGRACVCVWLPRESMWTIDGERWCDRCEIGRDTAGPPIHGTTLR